MKAASGVLVTGASGFLGSHLVLYLLKNTGIPVHCVVRQTGSTTARERLLQKLEGLLSGPLAQDPRFAALPADAWERLIVHVGDVTAPHLGLAPNTLKDSGVDRVWHVAADVRFDAHLRAEVLETNVGGTRRVLELIRREGIAELNFVSTAYVAGERSGAIAEEPAELSFLPNNSYEESKRIAEREILQAAEDGSFRFRIFRPSVIIGHSKLVAGDPEAGLSAYLRVLFKVKDTVERRMPDYFEHNPLRLGFDDGVTLNLIAVDHVVVAMHEIAQKSASLGGYFHVVNPRPIRVADYLKSLSDVLGIQIVNVPDASKLSPIDHLLWMKTDVYRSYHRDSKNFDCTKMLALSGLTPDELAIDGESERRYARWVYDAFLAERWVERSRGRSTVGMLTRNKLSVPGKPDLSYFVGGEAGETLLLLNAYGQSLAFWDRALPLLLKRFRVIAWQARGTASQGGGVLEVFPMTEHVADLERILEREKISGCHVLGWCTGPKVALELAARIPDRIHSLAFLTACFKGFPNVERFHTEYERHMDVICRTLDERPEVASAVMEILKRVITDEPAKTSVAPAKAVGELGYDESVDRVLAMVPEDIKPLVLEPFLTPENVVSYARQLLAFWKQDSSSKLPRADIPLLVIGGELDNIASAAMSREIASRIPGATYAEVRAGSHYMQFDNAELLTALLQAFLNAPREFSFTSREVELVRTPVGSSPRSNFSLAPELACSK